MRINSVSKNHTSFKAFAIFRGTEEELNTLEDLTQEALDKRPLTSDTIGTYYTGEYRTKLFVRFPIMKDVEDSKHIAIAATDRDDIELLYDVIRSDLSPSCFGLKESDIIAKIEEHYKNFIKGLAEKRMLNACDILKEVEGHAFDLVKMEHCNPRF